MHLSFICFLVLLFGVHTDLVAKSPKKGACITTKKGNKDKWPKKVASLNVSWHYSWGARLNKKSLDRVEFVPMIYGYWGTSDDLKYTIRNLANAKYNKTRKHLLGFNEPDSKKQANMSVDKALKAWPILEKTGLRLGSPATVHGDNDWMKEFMRKAKKQGRRVDFVTVHWYGNPNPDKLINDLKAIHKLYGKPIWLTEFGVADWNAKSFDQNKHTVHEVRQFMKEVLPRLDKLPFVERYAWFSAGQQSAHLGTSSLFNGDGSLTWLGKFYAAH